MWDSTLDHSICSVAATRIKRKMRRASTGVTLTLFLYDTGIFDTVETKKKKNKKYKWHSIIFPNTRHMNHIYILNLIQVI